MPSTPDHLANLIAAWPRLFKNGPPSGASDILPGWYGLMDAFCMEVNAVLTDQQAHRFYIGQIKEKFGGLRLYWVLQSEPGGPCMYGWNGGEAKADGQSSPAVPVADADAATRARVVDLVRGLRAAADTTCEVCGAAGELRERRGWLKTLCADHDLHWVRS